MLQHVSIFSDHLQGTRRFLVKVTEFKVFKIVKVVCGDAAVCVVCVRGAEHKVWCVCVVQSIKCGVCAWCRA